MASGDRPTIVFVSGFLGSGKTTLILAAAKRLAEAGKRCAVILNDQSGALVDTQLAALQRVPSREVVEGCFCCRFSDLTTQLDAVRAHRPEVIFAEPVGSCTDIAATVLHPLLAERNEFRIAPLTVLVDPARAIEAMRDDADPNIAFLFRKQLQEADLVCVTKADLQVELPPLGSHRLRRLSAKTGEGITAWLDEVLAGELPAYKDVLEIDYARYAQAEAALAWLNLRAHFEARLPVSPAMLLGPLLDRIDASLSCIGGRIVHLKAIAVAPTGYVKAALCESGAEPAVAGVLDASPATRHEITLNLRAIAEPCAIEGLVNEALAAMDGQWVHCELRCFRPAPPQPERRVSREQVAVSKDLAEPPNAVADEVDRHARVSQQKAGA